jgi:hypothetical protein
MATPPESSARFQVDCDGDPLYKELYERARASGGGEMQPLASMVVEIRMLPKDSKDTPRSK